MQAKEVDASLERKKKQHQMDLDEAIATIFMEAERAHAVEVQVRGHPVPLVPRPHSPQASAQSVHRRLLTRPPPSPHSPPFASADGIPPNSSTFASKLADVVVARAVGNGGRVASRTANVCVETQN